MKPSRRKIVLGGGLAAGTAAIGWGIWWRHPDPVDVMGQRILVLLPEVAAVAPAWRASASFARWGGDRGALAQAILGSALGPLAGEPPAATLKALTDAVDRDFEQDRMVLVDGWMLAETEARLIVFIAQSAV